MTRVICNAINRLLSSGKKLSELSKSDIWYNTSNSIYNQYTDEQDFINRFDISELDNLLKFKCCNCGKEFVRIKASDGLCEDCCRENNRKSLPQCKDFNDPEYQEWYAAFIENAPACQDENSDAYKSWYNTNPASADKNSDAHKNWVAANPAFAPDGSKEKEEFRRKCYENSPSCQSHDDPRYIKYYNNLFNAPQCQDINDPRYQEWYKINCECSPSCADENSDVHKNWYKKVIEGCPSNKPYDSPEYQDWYSALLNGLPNLKDPTSQEYKNWYKNVVMKIPNLQPKDSPIYKSWLAKVTGNNPACMDSDSPEYQEWKKKWEEGESNKEWHKYSDVELALMELRLPYVIRNEVGEEYLDYQDDGDNVRHFYPDFKIQVGYGVDPTAPWEWIEFKGDHLLNGIFDDQSQTTNKYNQWKSKVGFVPASYVWLFNICILHPDANKLWPNPRILAYAIYDIWLKKDELPIVNWMEESERVTVFNFIHDRYHTMNV